MSRLVGLATISLVAALSACGGRAAAPTASSAASPGTTTVSPGAAASVNRDAASRAERRDDRSPHGRPAGMRTLDINGQRTFWVENCPTDSSSPLREPCSMTRADVGTE